MNDEQIEIKMGESAIAWASQHSSGGHEELVSTAILRLQTASTPYPWLVPSAVARLQQIADLLSDEKHGEHGGLSGFGERRFKVYPDIQTGTPCIGSINKDGFVSDHRGQKLYRIYGKVMFDMTGALIGVIRPRGNNAVVTDPVDEDYLKLVLVSSD